MQPETRMPGCRVWGSLTSTDLQKTFPFRVGEGRKSGSPAELGIVHAGLVALHDSLNRIRECGIHGLMHDGCMISGILGSDASSLVPPKSSCPHSLKLFRFVLRMWRK